MLYEKISEWLKKYEPLNKWLYFNSTPYSIGSVAMNTVSGERIVKRYINGDIQKQIIFSLQMVSIYDTGTSNVNLDAIKECEKFCDWIEKENYPDFGDNKKIEKIEVLENVPNVLVNQELGQAVYSFQVRILYREEKINNA